MKRVISLTSIPSRFDLLGETLDSLLSQACDEVRLYIPSVYRRFPEWNGSLPKVPSGITVCRSRVDYGPATKILPACQDLRDQDVQILFCDDDCIAPKNWAELLFKIQARRPTEVVATYVRAPYIATSERVEGRNARQLPIEYDVAYRFQSLLHRILGFGLPTRRPFIIPGYGDVLFGVGGAVIRPKFFCERVYSIPEEVFYVDDIWLSANLKANRRRIYCPWRAPMPYSTRNNTVDGLQHTKFDSMSRQELNIAASLVCRDLLSVWS